MEIQHTKTYGMQRKHREVLRGTFTLNAYLEKQENLNLSLHLKELEKEQMKPKVRRKEIKIWAGIDEIEAKKNRKDQWDQELVLWKENWQTFS